MTDLEKLRDHARKMASIDHARRQRLSEYERQEIRNALGYHFDDCSADRDLQTTIITVIVERILARRPERRG